MNNLPQFRNFCSIKLVCVDEIGQTAITKSSCLHALTNGCTARHEFIKL